MGNASPLPWGRGPEEDVGLTEDGVGRLFSAYEGQEVADDQLVKKSDDWAIEETNFCLGRTSFVRYTEEMDLACGDPGAVAVGA